jgi:hypothetical protein
MRFDGSLGNVQIASDFRVVTTLKKQIYDLPFPGTHLIELFFHKTAPDRCGPGRCKWLTQSGRSAHLDSGLCVSFCIHAAKSVPGMLTNCKKPGYAAFILEKRRLLQCSPARNTVIPGRNYRWFYSASRVNHLVQNSGVPAYQSPYLHRSTSEAGPPTLPYNELWTSSW